MRIPRNTSTSESDFPSAEFDRPDGFHINDGYINAAASLARVLNDRSNAAWAEEAERLRQRIDIDEFGKRHSHAGMTVERIREISNIHGRISAVGGEER